LQTGIPGNGLYEILKDEPKKYETYIDEAQRLKTGVNWKNIFDKQIKNVYNKNRNESHRQCVLPILIDYTTQLGKAKCGVFLYLFVSPHYVYNTQQGDIYGY
jgi:hypothetical protein